MELCLFLVLFLEKFPPLFANLFTLLVGRWDSLVVPLAELFGAWLRRLEHTGRGHLALFQTLQTVLLSLCGRLSFASSLFGHCPFFFVTGCLKLLRRDELDKSFSILLILESDAKIDHVLVTQAIGKLEQIQMWRF